MALIDLDTPDGADEWRDDIAARVLAVVLGAMILRFGLHAWAAAAGDNGLVGAIPTFVAFALGVQILLLSVTDLDLRANSRRIAFVTTGLLAVLALVTVLEADRARLGTDLLAFTSYAVELVAEGGNPVAASMAPAHDLPGAPEQWTPRTDGTLVDSWSYPTGTVWVYSAYFAVLGRSPWGLRVVGLVGVVAIAALVTYVVPEPFGLLGPASLLLAQNEFLAALGGLNDMWWVLPTVATVWLWAIDRRVAAAATFGVACAMKQQPWAIALPLAIWVYKEAPTRRVFAKRAATYIGVGGAAFALLNLPWLVTTPAAWLDAVLTPLAADDKAPLVSMGVGLAILNQAVDAQLVSRGTFEMLIYLSVAVATVAYWRWFDSIRWVAFLLPAAIFLWTPRSLPSYFHWFVPVAVVAMFAAHGRLRGQREVPTA